jgi:acetolactate synthase-1/2/3 large subunit
MRAALEVEADTMAASARQPIHPLRVIRTARAVFPRDASVAIDVGVLAQGMGGAFPYFKIFGPRQTIVPSSFYGMGFSAAAAPVAKLVRPNHPAVCFVGDGSFNMVMNIMPMAAEYGLPVTWCILDDQALGSIRDIQQTYFNGRYIGTEFSFQPDFGKVAEACGCYGEKITDPAEVEPALRRAIAANEDGRPAVLDFIVAKERLPASLEFFER